MALFVPLGHALACAQAPFDQLHCGSPPASSCVQPAMLVACAGHEPIASPHEPVNEQPAAPHAAAPASKEVGQLGAAQAPVHWHCGSAPVHCEPVAVIAVGQAVVCPQPDPAHVH